MTLALGSDVFLQQFLGTNFLCAPLYTHRIGTLEKGQKVIYIEVLNKTKMEQFIDGLSEILLNSDLAVAAGVNCPPNTFQLIKYNIYDRGKCTRAQPCTANPSYEIRHFFYLLSIKQLGEKVAANLKHAINVKYLVVLIMLVTLSIVTIALVLFILNGAAEPWEEIIDMYSNMELSYSESGGTRDSSTSADEISKLPSLSQDANIEVDTSAESSIESLNFSIRAPQKWSTTTRINRDLKPDGSWMREKSQENPEERQLGDFVTSLVTYPDREGERKRDFHGRLFRYLQTALQQDKIGFVGDIISEDKLRLLQFVISHDYVGDLKSVMECMFSLRWRIREYHGLLSAIIPQVKADTRREVVSLTVCGWIFNVFEYSGEDQMISLLDALLIMVAEGEQRSHGMNSLSVISGILSIDELIPAFLGLMRIHDDRPDKVIVLTAICKAISHYICLNEMTIINYLTEDPTANKMRTPVARLLQFVNLFFLAIADTFSGASRDEPQSQLSFEMARYIRIYNVMLANENVPVAVLVEISNSIIVELYRQVRWMAPNCAVPEPVVAHICSPPTPARDLEIFSSSS